MEEPDIMEFLDRLKRVHAASVLDDVTAEAHTQEIPYAAREALLTRLRNDLFEQAMAFDPRQLASGGSVVTAVIKAAYAPLDAKTDEFEYCIYDFLGNLLKIVGIEDEHATFTRSMIVNEQERIQTVLTAAQYLPQEYVTRKILTILGDGDQADDLLNQIEQENMDRMAAVGAQEDGSESGAQTPGGEGSEGTEGGTDGKTGGIEGDGEEPEGNEGSGGADGKAAKKKTAKKKVKEE